MIPICSGFQGQIVRLPSPLDPNKMNSRSLHHIRDIPRKESQQAGYPAGHKWVIQNLLPAWMAQRLPGY
jgi:hypothetical protein